MEPGLRDWTVASGLVDGPEGLLLVCNRRRWGGHDWSPPGGVIAPGEEVLAGLTREVREETGITVTGWEGPVYRVSAVAAGMGWHLRCEVYVARSFEGELDVDDPDEIVVDAAFLPRARCDELLAGCFRWVREPLGDWLDERWGSTAPRRYHYAVHGSDPRSLRVERLALP